MKKYKILIILFCSGFFQNICAQKFLYDVDFVTYFDNREYHSELQKSKTVFGMRLSPEIGIGLGDSLGGTHRVMAGASYIQPFGAYWESARVYPTIYYEYCQKGFTASLGAVPYSHMFHALPDYLMSDSMAYAYPNIQGALFQYVSKWGFAEFLCDWRGMESSDTREAFRLIVDGRFNYKWFLAGGYAQMNHLANKSDDQPNLGVCDDIYLNPFVGVDFSNKTPLDSLSFQVGYILGLQRDRKRELSYVPQGCKIDLFLRWRFLGLQNSFYVGNNLMPLYAECGTLLNQGNPFYQAQVYNRTDVFIYIIRRSFVNCYFSWNFHYTQGDKLSHQQQLIVRFNLDGLKHRNTKLRGVFDK
ncbi:MAG: hypothetical protein PHH23_01180 [Paludibacteraceae bacterium]|nr:hypothetical protein [Paludibacteraceae bacterium]